MQYPTCEKAPAVLNDHAENHLDNAADGGGNMLGGWGGHAVKAKGHCPLRQAGFRKDFRTTNNIFILGSLIDRQKQSRQKGKAGKPYCCFVDLRKELNTVSRAVLWQVLEELFMAVFMAESWTSSSLYMHTTAQQCDHHKAFLPSSEVSLG
ncbi:TPA: hypothetical protein ACH3X1_004596 [Trebouxia sp. C0004]